MPSLGMPPSPHLHVFTNLEAIQISLARIFMKESLSRRDWLNYCSLVIKSVSSPSPLPGGWGIGLKFWSFWWQSWLPLQPALFLRLTRSLQPPAISLAFKSTYHLGDSKGFRSSVPSNRWQKPTIYYIVTGSNHKAGTKCHIYFPGFCYFLESWVFMSLTFQGYISSLVRSLNRFGFWSDFSSFLLVEATI